MPGLFATAIRLLVITFVLAAGARADDFDVLYQTQAIVTGTGETNRQPGFEECLRDVVVKVSGDQRVLKHPKLAEALPKVGSYVASFRYRDRLEGIPIHDEQGTHDRPHDLFCTFDRVAVDALLAEAGGNPWLDKRPRLVLFLSVEQAAKRFVLTRDGDDSPYMRDSLLAAAEPWALQVDVPQAETLVDGGISVDNLAGLAPDQFAPTVRQAGGDAPMRGSLVWSDAELGWIADWQLATPEKVYAWQVRGVSFDDAFRNAMAGALQVLSGNGQPE